MRGDHPNSIVALGNLANIIGNQGRFAEAEPMFEKAVDKAIDLIGIKNPTSADIMCKFGNMLQVQMSKYHEAGLMFMTAADAYIDAYGMDHPKAKVAMQRTQAMMEAKVMMAALRGG